jgi:arginase
MTPGVIHFIVSPYHLGRRAEAVGAGPLAVMEALNACHATVIDVGDAAEWPAVNAAIRAAVVHARAQSRFPLVLAGNCNSCLGTLAALTNPEVVWFDAHGDFHTIQTSISGSIEGMCLATAVEQFGIRDAVLVGGRNLDPGESERVRGMLRHVSSPDLNRIPLPSGSEVYVHVDVDVLDPSVSPGTNFQGPGGFTVEELAVALTEVVGRCQVSALAITNYNPSKDVENRTRNVILQLIAQVSRLHANCASR